MKTIALFIAMSIPLICGAQTKWYIDTLSIGHPMIDSVRWPTDVNGVIVTGDIAAYPSSVTIITIGLTDTLTIDFGKSNNVLSRTAGGSILTAPFQGIEHDSLPYLFIAARHQVVTNSDTTCEQNINFPDPWLALRPSYKVTTHQDTICTLIIRWIFAK